MTTVVEFAPVFAVVAEIALKILTQQNKLSQHNLQLFYNNKYSQQSSVLNYTLIAATIYLWLFILPYLKQQQQEQHRLEQ